MADSNCIRPQENTNKNGICHATDKTWNTGYVSTVRSQARWDTARPIGACALGVDDGVAARVDRAKAIGNGQVPQVMAMAFCILHERLSKRVGNGA